jgi:hypothetical protein
VFSQFITLDIERENHSTTRQNEQWTLVEKITLSGMGSPIAMAVRDRVNRLENPFVTVWDKRSWVPWDWALTSLQQAEIPAEETEISF